MSDVEKNKTEETTITQNPVRVSLSRPAGPGCLDEHCYRRHFAPVYRCRRELKGRRGELMSRINAALNANRLTHRYIDYSNITGWVV